MKSTIKHYQQSIAKKVKELRKQRLLTQKELADYLDLSQNRISQIEAGQGSFSAEHLLLLAKKFNLPASSFVDEEQKAQPTLQNALARHGAEHLRENEDTLPSEKLDDILRLVREVLASPADSRAVAALAPVIVQDGDPSVLNRIRLRLIDDGIVQRYGWLLDNVHTALRRELSGKLSDDWREKYERAEYILRHQLAFPWDTLTKTNREDVFDSIVTQKTLEEVRKESSAISKKWKLVTRIHPKEFIEALKEARESH